MERDRCLRALLGRYQVPGSAALKARIYDAFRSATGINCPESIREAARTALADIELADEVAVVDAICTAEHNLPFESSDLSNWERAISKVIVKGRSSLERLNSNPQGRARFVIERLSNCLDLNVRTEGFSGFMLGFSDSPDFLAELADQLIAHPRAEAMVGYLTSVLGAIHMGEPQAFRRRALSALSSGTAHIIHAAAANLRVFSGATKEDVAVIKAFGSSDDAVAKRGAIHAIAYMGKFTELRPHLKEALLSIRTEGDAAIATDFVNALGPYGLPITCLTHEEAACVASQFLHVPDWDADQGAIPRFLCSFVQHFPDETYQLLLSRVEEGVRRKQNNQRWFRSFRLVHQSVSFSGVPIEKRFELGRDCIGRLLAASDSAVDLARLFWDVAGYDTQVFQLIVESARGADECAVRNIAVLIETAIPGLAFSNPEFAKGLLRQFAGANRTTIVRAFVHQAVRLGDGGVFVGSAEDHMARQQQEFTNRVASFPDEPGLEDLKREFRKLM